MQDSLDSLLEEALAGSGATSPQDAVVVALHSTLLAAGFECIAVGDEVNEFIVVYFKLMSL